MKTKNRKFPEGPVITFNALRLGTLLSMWSQICKNCPLILTEIITLIDRSYLKFEKKKKILFSIFASFWIANTLLLKKASILKTFKFKVT